MGPGRRPGSRSAPRSRRPTTAQAARPRARSTRRVLRAAPGGRGPAGGSVPGHALREVVEEIEERALGPMEVLQDEHDRLLARQRLEETACGPKSLATRARRL